MPEARTGGADVLGPVAIERKFYEMGFGNGRLQPSATALAVLRSQKFCAMLTLPKSKAR